MPPAHPAAPNPVSNGKKPLGTGWKLGLATVLIGAAVVGLTLVDRWRDRPAAPIPPHEPSQALITSPQPETAPPSAASGVLLPPPPPPEVVNNEKLAPPPTIAALSAARPAATEAKVPEPAGKAYMVQVGVFTSPANAQALQRQLKRADINAHLETRVQLGPFKDRQEADKALARAKKLGIDAVLVGPH